jgi:hypothetical protein
MRITDWGLGMTEDRLRNADYGLGMTDDGLLITLLKLPLVFTALACSFLGSFIMIKLAFF